MIVIKPVLSQSFRTTVRHSIKINSNQHVIKGLQRKRKAQFYESNVALSKLIHLMIIYFLCLTNMFVIYFMLVKLL